MKDSIDDYRTTREASQLFGVSQDHVRKLLFFGKIRGKRLGHDWLVFIPSLESYLANKAKRGRPSGSGRRS